MIFLEEKVRIICEKLDEMREKELYVLNGFSYTPCGYKLKIPRRLRRNGRY